LIPAGSNPFSKMLIAAWRSRSNTAPQQQRWVLVDSDFLTILPQAEQSKGSVLRGDSNYCFTVYFPKILQPEEQIDPTLIANRFGKLVVLNHILHLKVNLGHKIALILPRRASS
jgi:hypothetical protein